MFTAENCLKRMRGFSDFTEPDPGSAGTIYVEKTLSECPVVTAAAEARTLAQPDKAGLVHTVVLDTDGGDLTLTVTGGFNADGDTSITFADAGDFVTFISIKVGTAYYWRVIGQEGTNAAIEDMVVDQLTVATLTLGATALTATGAEINQLDGAILADMTPGTGISGATNAICEHRVTKIGGLIKTEILVDLTGLADDDAQNDIIGKPDDTANCHIGQISAAVNGTIIAGRVTCFETPAGGDPDVDIWGTVTEATGAQGAGIAALTGETQLIDHGDWTAEDVDHLSALPGAGYLYLTVGAAVPDNGTYTAGILLIELWGK